MRTQLLGFVLAPALALAGCSSGSKAPSTPTNTDPGTGAAASETSCTSDVDCAAVETQCCDHCNGGTVLAFNKASAEAHKPTGCEQTMCTEMACGQAVASCQSGTCAVSIAPLH